MATTFAELLSATASLRPRDAILSNTIQRDLCVTPLISEIVMPGESEPRKLTRPGKPGAGYCRVSTERQRADGFSIEEQITRIIHYFVEREQPFCVYNDASLSGFYPPKDKSLIELMVQKHAERYERNMRTIFLDGKGTKTYTPAQRESIEAHLEKALKKIKEASDVIFTETGEITLIKRGGKITYRPAFTLLLQDLNRYDVLAVSDLSRLYRNEAIAHELSERLNVDGCTARIEGLIESLEFLNRGKSQDFGAQMQKWFFGFMAERFLNQVTVNTLRGTLQMLEGGRPHGKLPYFLMRDKDNYAMWKPGAREAILRLAELIGIPDPTTGKRRSYSDVSDIMRAEGHPSLGHTREWNRRIITEMLSNSILAGKHIHFGLEFELPGVRVMNMEEFLKLQAILDDTKKLNARHQAKLKRTQLQNEQGVLEIVCYLATGLLRCVCGGRMCHTRIGGAGKKWEAYSCTDQIENRKKDVRHTRLFADDVHRFIRDVMLRYREVATVFRDDSKYATQRTALAEANEDVITHKLALDQKAAALQVKHTVTAEDEGFEGKELVDYVHLIVRNATKREREEFENAEQRRNDVQAELDVYTTNDEADRINAKVEQWDTLEVREQNAIILRVFDRWEVRGNDPNCYVTPILRDGRELPPVTLITKVQQFVKRDRANYTRRFPDAAAWYQDVKRELMGSEWYGEVIGFQYRDDIPDEFPDYDVQDTLPNE